MIQSQICPLCNQEASLFHTNSKFDHFLCDNCGGISKGKQFYLNDVEEKARYELHQNNVHDLQYQKFVSPITQAVARDFNTTHQGLDFGSGPGPVIQKVLQDKGYHVVNYDPYFFNDKSVLTENYHFITCSEVLEHLYNPSEEIKMLKGLLRPNGKLYCMTLLYDERMEFDQWYYKNDPTHVFLYQSKTMEYICKKFDFLGVEIQQRLITFYV